MIMKAIVTTPRSGKWGVNFYAPEGGEGPQDWTAPAFFIPCYTYEHAQAVVNAFNAGHVQPQPAKVQSVGDLIEEDIEAATREGRHYAEPR